MIVPVDGVMEGGATLAAAHETLGTVLHAVARQLPGSVTVDVAGEPASEEVLMRAGRAAQGIHPHRRGTGDVRQRTGDRRRAGLTTAPVSDNHSTVVQSRAAMPDGCAITGSGTLTGRAQVGKP
jgi:D-3-phosphoglycerate dehydrogenase